MKFSIIMALGLAVNGHRLDQHLIQRSEVQDEVDDLLMKQDEKDAKEVSDKEFNDANSKVNQIGLVSRQHSAAEDEDYMNNVFN